MENLLEKTKILSVVIFKAGGRTFDYSDPKGLASLGSIVQTSFGRKMIFGIVIEMKEDSDVPSNQLKPIQAVLPAPFCINQNQMQLLKWLSQYYQVAIGRLVTSCFPLTVLADSAPLRPYVGGYALDHQQVGRLTKAQKACVTWMQASEHRVFTIDLLLEALFSKRTIHALIDQQVLVPFQDHELPQIHLSQMQSAVFEKISQHQGPDLLYGVTGSGKTHIYMALTQKVIQEGHQVLILVPEIGLTPQTMARFVAHLGVSVTQWHSKLSDSQRKSVWSAVSQNQIAVVIGTRSALFLPFRQLKLIILDEEHDLSFYQQGYPSYSVRDAAVVLAKQSQAKIVLGSATPSMESWSNVIKQKYSLLELNQSFSQAEKHIHIVDMRREKLIDQIAKPILDRAQVVLDQGRQMLFFLNRRGYHPVTLCHACGWVMKCDHCDVKLNYSKITHSLRCHLCQKYYSLPTACGHCASDEIIQAGLGTERLTESLQALFPSVPVIRIDADTMQSANSWVRVRKQIQKGEPMLIVGTQMIAKGHDFHHLTDVAIMDTDHALYATDFRSIERWGQMIFQVAGRCGRGQEGGHIWVQSHIPHHPALPMIQAGQYDALMNFLIEQRQAALWPPFSFCAKVKDLANHQQALLERLKYWQTQIQHHQVEVLGPIIPPVSKRNNAFHGYLLLKSKERDPLFHVCHELVKLGAVVEVDPQELDH